MSQPVWIQIDTIESEELSLIRGFSGELYTYKTVPIFVQANMILVVLPYGDKANVSEVCLSDRIGRKGIASYYVYETPDALMARLKEAGGTVVMVKKESN